MQVHFWGTRGSLPAPLTHAELRTKLRRVLQAARGKDLATDREIARFLQTLPFSVRATYGGNTSCIEIRGGTEYVLCDAGTGIRDFSRYVLQTAASGRKPAGNVFHLFLSHPHWDHIQGFPFFTPAYFPGTRITIYGCHDRLRETFAGQQNAPYFPVPLEAMQAQIQFVQLEPGQEYTVGGLNVRATGQCHPGGSYGYRFPRGGKTLVYATDSEHKQNAVPLLEDVVKFFAGADVLIFDAQYTHAEAIDVKENWGHSSNLMAVELAVRAGVRRLCLFHHEHTYGDDMLEQFLKETRQYIKIYDQASSLRVEMAYDGLDIRI
jgi:phosphoribosyl 1,2-cyclic phosphodiesterase